jgi:D-3-phosphoglycerate dehydrogenase
MSTPRILITDDVHPHLISGFESMGYDVDYIPEISLAEVHDCIAPYYGIVINTKIKAYRELLTKAPNLNVIARLGSGLDIIDLDAAREFGIKVISTPEGNAQSVAEHALGMLLCLLNKFLSADRQLREFTWQREAHRGTELMGKHVGLVGYGHTGKAFARLLEPFSIYLHIYDPYVQRTEMNDRMVFHDDLDSLVKVVDILSLHVQLTPETKCMVDKVLLGKMKRGAILVNTSRGKVVDTEALVSALESEFLGGACLDVFENEQTGTYSESETALYSRLYRRNNVVLTPHVAGWTHESKFKIADTILTKWKSRNSDNF